MQSNNMYVLEFSSVGGSLIPPIVEKQAYILPGFLQAMKPTITEKGITSKHILSKSFFIIFYYKIFLLFSFSGYYNRPFVRSTMGILRSS